MSGKSARVRRKKAAGAIETAKWTAFVRGLGSMLQRTPQATEEIVRTITEHPETREPLANWTIEQFPKLPTLQRAQLVGMLARLDGDNDGG
jgi:hypothetical protein